MRGVLTYSKDGTARICSVSDPSHPIVLEGHSDRIRGARFSADESRVLTYSSDGTARIWDLDIDRILQQLYEEYPVMMRQPLDEELKRKYGLEGLYLEKMKK